MHIPHCVPCALYSLSWTGCSSVEVDPRPSTVVTEQPCREHSLHILNVK